jgi:SAM-dependent methyltransferase
LKACIPGEWAEYASRIEYGISEELVLPFRTEEVDAVTCISVLEHVSDPPRLMREILRILKPGGVLILTMDISLESNQGISAEHLNEICNLLEADCAPAHPIELVHPQELLVFPGSPRGLVPAPWNPPPGVSERVVGWIKWQYEHFRKRLPSPRSLCLFVGTYLKKGAQDIRAGRALA